MLKKYKKTLLITSAVILLPIAVGFIYWDRLPDPMATHFGMNNEADGFTGKAFAVFGLPLLMLAVQWISAFVTMHDPRRQNISGKLFTMILWLIPVITLVGSAYLYVYNLGHRPNMAVFSRLLLGIVFLVVGNYLPKIRQNYSIGIKVPWTLADEDNWNRTHRLAGALWMGCGLCLCILALTGNESLFWTLVPIVIATAVPVIYSFLQYRSGLNG